MRERGIDFEWRDIGKEPLTRAELETLVGKRDPSDFLNPRSTPYRELALKDRKLPRGEALALLASNPNFLRRPLLVKGSKYVFGFDREAYEAL